MTGEVSSEVNSSSDYLTYLIETSLQYTGGSNDADRNEARHLIPQVREANKQLLASQGINLDEIEQQGYTPWGGTGHGEMNVITVGEDKGYLLVKRVEDIRREHQYFRYKSPYYLVMNGRVNKQVYLESDPDNFGINLIDMRGGKINKQEIRFKEVQSEPNHWAYEANSVDLDGEKISAPVVGFGHFISVRSDHINPSATEISKSDNWVKSLK